MLETGCPRIWRLWNWRGCSPYPRCRVQPWTATNTKSIQSVCIVDMLVVAIKYSYHIRPPNRRPYLRQSMMLTGLSSPKFNDAILSMRAIEDIFKQRAIDRNMEAWIPSAFQGHPSIDVGNRYFTPCQHALQDHHISFSSYWPRQHTLWGNGRVSAGARRLPIWGQLQCWTSNRMMYASTSDEKPTQLTISKECNQCKGWIPC